MKDAFSLHLKVMPFIILSGVMATWAQFLSQLLPYFFPPHQDLSEE